MIETNEPPGLPSRSGRTTTVTLSPALMVVRFHPASTRFCGPFISTAQTSSLPSAAGTLTLNEECGLVQLNSVMVPTSVCSFVGSNMAPEWCTQAGAEAINRATVNAMRGNLFMMTPEDYLAGGSVG